MKEIWILVCVDVWTWFEKVLMFLADLLPGLLLLPDYLDYYDSLESSTNIQETTEAQIHINELIRTNSVLAACDLLWDKWIQAIKNLGTALAWGKQKEVAMILSLIIWLLAGVGIAKAISLFKKSTVANQAAAVSTWAIVLNTITQGAKKGTMATTKSSPEEPVEIL